MQSAKLKIPYKKEMYAEMKINAFDIPYLAGYMEVPNKKDMYVEITSRSM